ncbi:low molecular weight protein-tyrosine-phosphatase [Companilactobacillus bobalius]|uniref:low molecular weight protein-tyrosine-phosphatase n=1 Tax=Companilactobacillus bobalius TaxID=2801451 RepID=UPI001302B031|nr:low molecular weight protein-tyrosine-phosphatase [Companilactobacillus bobalius]KAE9560267.1 protein tyrosine phosphatase [Companilactobacillus bobalius]
MKKIIFVCLGNICRSPMAEMMMKQLVDDDYSELLIKVESRATSTYEIGNFPHPGAIAELKKRNVPIIKHVAKQITTQDFDEADLIIGMDEQNIADLKQMAPISDRDKIRMAYEALNSTAVIEDPWYDHKFDRTYRQLAEVLPIWLEELRS